MKGHFQVEIKDPWGVITCYVPEVMRAEWEYQESLPHSERNQGRIASVILQGGSIIKNRFDLRDVFDAALL